MSEQSKCPNCLRDLDDAPRRMGESLITYIGAIAYHSGVCEMARLSQLNLKKNVWITAFPMPRDLEMKYGAS